MQNLAKEPLKIGKIDRIRILGIELELACTRGSISSLRGWRFCSHGVKSFGGGATTTSGVAASSRFRPYSSRGFAAKTFDPARPKPPATQATR